MNIQPLRILDYKTYNSIPHLSGSRLGESDSTIDRNLESWMTNKFPDNASYILYIEEKMDGSNVSVVRFNGTLITLSRSGFNCAHSNQEQHRMFDRWVKDHIDMFEELLPNEHDRVVGEWLALAHGTIYPDTIAHVPFQGFDLYRNKVQQNVQIRNEEFYKHNIRIPSPIYTRINRAVPIEEALDKLNLSHPHSEGLIYRLERKFKKEEDFKPLVIAKIVKLDKEDGKYLKDEEGIPLSDDKKIWNWRDDRDKCICEKHQNKKPRIIA